MRVEEFIEEVKTSSICPDNFDSVYGEFQRYQKLALGALIAFHSVCEKNSIGYQLAYGSLLGIVRDKGQIPWDYDIDVFVPFDQKERLVDALAKDLDSNYYFYSPDTDKKCRHYMIRVSPIGFRSEALHVDVFYLIGAPEKNTKQFARECRYIFQKRFDKMVNLQEESYGRIRTYIKLLLKKALLIPLTKHSLDKKYYDLCTRFDYEQSKYSISFDDESDKYVYITKKMKDTFLLDSDMGTFRIPKNYEYVLRTIYGDYLTVPPLTQRLQEMSRAYRRIQLYNGKK